MPGPGEQVAHGRAGKRDQRIDRDEPGEERHDADPGAEHMQRPRAALRVVTEIVAPKLIESLVCAGHDVVLSQATDPMVPCGNRSSAPALRASAPWRRAARVAPHNNPPGGPRW